MYLDLVISRVGVHEAEQFMTRCRIHQLNNPWQGEAVFGTGLIEVEVNGDFFICGTSSPKSAPGEPIRVVCLPDEVV